MGRIVWYISQVASPRVRTTVLVFAVCLLAPPGVIAGDAFLKLGYILHPELPDFEPAWLITGGSDWRVAPQAFLGFEVQGSYKRHTSNRGMTTTRVPINLFMNLRWKSGGDSIRPYAGGGIGLIGGYLTDLSAEADNWHYDAGVQLAGGFEFNRRFVVELLAQRAFEEFADWHWSVLVGLRF